MERHVVYSLKKKLPVKTITRENTSDLSMFAASMTLWGRTADEYKLSELPDLEGVALDIGAHIGSVTLALLADHPGLRVIAVEPLVDNANLLREMLAENGWTDRCEVIVGAIAKGKTAQIAWDFSETDYLVAQRYIGGLGLGTLGTHEMVEVPALKMRNLVTADTVFAKLDCESCEWEAFRDPAVLAIPWVVAEGHGDNWEAKARKVFEATHTVTVLEDHDGTGVFRAVIR